MRKTITKIRCINHITVFSFLALISILVLGVFVVKLRLLERVCPVGPRLIVPRSLAGGCSNTLCTRRLTEKRSLCDLGIADCAFT